MVKEHSMKDSWLTPLCSSRGGRAGIAGLLLCLALAGCGGNSSGPESSDLTDFTLTAEQLETEVRQDEQEAERKYERSNIELSGVVQSMYGDEPVFIGLYRGKGLLGLPCAMVDDEPWARVTFGQQVTVKGVWREDADKPSLQKCVIVATGPNPAPRLSAVQLATEYAAGIKKADSKYSGKYLIVSGVILGKHADPMRPSVILKGTKKMHIHIALLPNYQQWLANQAVGKHVTIFANSSGAALDESAIAFDDGRPITK
jgi:hypothetical protein